MPEQRQPTPEEMEALREKIKNMSPEELKEFQKKQCIFCQIIEGKIQAKKVYEDEKTIGILDINPANPGHILLLPKEHYSVMPQIPEQEVAHLFMASKFLSNAVLKTLEASGTNIIVANGPAAGQKAQHFMVHIIPRKEGDGVEFSLPQKKHSEADLDAVAGKIRARLAQVLRVKKGELIKKEAKKAPQLQIPVPAKEIKQPPKIKPPVEAVVKEEPGSFVTSAAAKRFHTERCPFAKNIPDEKRIHISAEDAESEGKKPCTCTGLVKKIGKGARKSTMKAEKKEPPKEKKKKPPQKEPKPKEKPKEEAVDLDDIARVLGV
ncbi:HIT family protein [Candidatus Woesearchaeota archaeon]|nr:HIT family protein [Candidatus Woesearchaeota archaeon]